MKLDLEEKPTEEAILDFIYLARSFGVEVPLMQVPLEIYRALELSLGSRVQYRMIQSGSDDKELIGICLWGPDKRTTVLPILPPIMK